ncbi:hypothetical protein A3B87_02025 [Candidatus Kuenenbacteria bacterium RIFCSPHIGHO2_02_FULL_39_13]|uniref:Addiction module toxin RelE n=1 Tax=Candidatus Kuenenbacteria bacterium RIFCSPHIGHO2_02_FULL_39_13 TaxID=1798561 RepID=A0A1F6FL29_9BACT|nr:MAG: hypothetical protein A3B87_02025 [Candidatus Kuenenbacteria bacterium RIFCSPHIGHO2_02_FULL_39_13]
MYEIKFRKSVKKDFKRLDSGAREMIVGEILPALSLNPRQGEKFRTKKISLWKFGFSFNGVEYRIIYDIYEQELVILVIMIGSRENFYRKLNLRLR